MIVLICFLVRAGVRLIVIIEKKVDLELDELTDKDWTTGSYQYILNKYNASDVKEYPSIHAVDILSIATQSDPIPMKDVSNDFLEHLEGIYLGEPPLAKTLREDEFKMKIDGKGDSNFTLDDVECGSRISSYEA